MEVPVKKEFFEEIKAHRQNSLFLVEEWTPMKGFLFIECENEQIIAEVLECEHVGDGRWLAIFNPIGEPITTNEPSISGSLEEVPTPRPNHNWKQTLNSLIKHENGYFR